MRKFIKTEFQELNESEHKLLSSGCDSLFLYLDCGNAINWAGIIRELEQVEYNEIFTYKGAEMLKVKAYIKCYPNCFQIGQFQFFVNVATCYIRVLSLAFEMRGFQGAISWLCQILDRLREVELTEDWLDYLIVSRIDVFTDFAYENDFDINRFKTKLKASGYCQAANDEQGKTYYFGSRKSFYVRLYCKSAEVKTSGKDYLVSSWADQGCQDRRIWRLEFEFRKRKLDELFPDRTLKSFTRDSIGLMLAFGVEKIQYMAASAKNRNLHKMELHPVWESLKTAHTNEYNISLKAVGLADIEFRTKRAKTWVKSVLVAKGYNYESIPEIFRDWFKIRKDDYNRDLKKYQNILHKNKQDWN